VYVRRLERRLFFLVTRKAEPGLLLLQNERPDDAVALVARLAVLRVGERRMHELLRCFLLHLRVALDAIL